MPFFRPAPQQYQTPVAQPSRPSRQPFRSARNDIYLPPMPEMLNPVNRVQEGPRYVQEPAPAPVMAPASATLASNRGLPVIRGQAPEEPQTRPIARLLPPDKIDMPAPEAMGIATQKPVLTASRVADWSAARGRLDQLGASHYRLEKTNEGGFRFSCALPQSGANSQERQFEAQAGSEPEAIALAMQQVETWTNSRK